MSQRSVNRAPMLARDVMAKRLVTVRPETDVAEAVHLLLHHGISGMPVVDAEGTFVGVFAEKSCLRVLSDTANLVHDPATPPPRARDVMITRLICLSPRQDVFEAIDTLVSKRVSGAPVTEPDGTFLGSISEETAMSVLINGGHGGRPPAVDLFGHGAVETAQPRLDGGDRDIELGRRQGGRHRTVDVAHDDQAIKRCAVARSGGQHLFHPFQNACSLDGVRPRPNLQMDIRPLHIELLKKDV